MKKKNNFFQNNNLWSTIAFVVMMIAGVASLIWLHSDYGKVRTLSYSEVLTLVDNNQIAEAQIAGQQFYAQTRDGQKVIANVVMTESLLQKLYQAGTQVYVDKDTSNSWMTYFLMLVVFIFLGILAFVFFNFFKNMQGGGGSKLFDIGKSKARFHPAQSVKTKFADVAGFEEVKNELKDIVEFLKNPDKFKKLGAKIPRGVLLCGAPGNGKTLLAKAVAGEAHCPFLSISGSDFVEVFVGVGASRVRDLFFQARRNSPSIIFIDEIDAVGRQRGLSMSGGNEEREQTLNQLLAEMDGFSTQPGEVIVLAATNRVDVLDKALLRPGRFDRTVNVPFPDLKTREKILRVHAKGVAISSDVDFMQIARATPGCSGADLANLINEAALLTAKHNRDQVTIADLESASDKLFLGTENKTMIRTAKELRETAYHEGGHALINMLMPDTDPFHKVTIIARGHALGVSFSLPEMDQYTHNREYFLARITVAMGGLLAEKLVLGTQTSGVSNDLEKATQIARAMVCSYGMSDLGPVTWSSSRDYYAKNEYSQATAEHIDQQVRKILDQQYQFGRELLEKNIDKLHLLAEALLKHETISAEQAYKLLDIPARMSHTFKPVEKEAILAPEADQIVPNDQNDDKDTNSVTEDAVDQDKKQD